MSTHDRAKQRLNTLMTMALRWGSDMIQLCHTRYSQAKTEHICLSVEFLLTLLVPTYGTAEQRLNTYASQWSSDITCAHTDTAKQRLNTVCLSCSSSSSSSPPFPPPLPPPPPCPSSSSSSPPPPPSVFFFLFSFCFCFCCAPCISTSVYPYRPGMC